MTARQCADFLIERVGFDRANAEGEVRRSFNGSYEPIYQCAYHAGRAAVLCSAQRAGGFREDDESRIP